MKKIYLVLATMGLVLFSNAQFQWAKSEGLWAYDYGYGIATDGSGNVYVAGKYEENAVFSGNTVSCAGNHDAFLARYNSDGTLGWIRTSGGNMGDYAQALNFDGSHLYIAGEIEGYGTVISFPPSSTTLQCQGDNDIFFAKYDLSGNLVWAKSEGGVLSEKALAVGSDANGNVYIAGYFTGSTSIGGVTMNSAGYRDIFLAKYNSSGAFQWVRSAGSIGRDEAKGLRVDAAGNAYICGMYSNNCDFGGGTNMTCQGNYFEAFIAKYAADGTLQWVRRGGSDFDDVAWSITMDNNGKLYITGEFNAYATFDGGNALVTSGNADVFVACYDASGAIQWVKRAGGTLNDRARGIGTNGNTIFITGQFGSSVAFGGNVISAADSSDVFLAAISSSGDWLWGASVGGAADTPEPLGYESGIAITGDANGMVYATGGLLDGGTFGNITVSPYTRTDIFVTKFAAVGIGFNENATDVSLQVFPNPAKSSLGVRFSNSSQDARLFISNVLGQTIASYQAEQELNIDLSAYAEGVYFVEVKSRNAVLDRKKLLIQK